MVDPAAAPRRGLFKQLVQQRGRTRESAEQLASAMQAQSVAITGLAKELATAQTEMKQTQERIAAALEAQHRTHARPIQIVEPARPWWHAVAKPAILLGMAGLAFTVATWIISDKNAADADRRAARAELTGLVTDLATIGVEEQALLVDLMTTNLSDPASHQTLLAQSNGWAVERRETLVAAARDVIGDTRTSPA